MITNLYRSKVDAMRSLAVLALLAISAPCIADNSVRPNPSIECLAALPNKPEFAPLKGKMMLGEGDTPLEILANNTKPNNTEKAALSKFVLAGEHCMHLGDEWRTTYIPLEGQALFDSYMATVKGYLADLYGGKITYGDYAKKRDAAVAKFKADIAVLRQKLMEQQQAGQEMKEQEEQRRAEEAQHQQSQLAAQKEQTKRELILQYMREQQQNMQNMQNLLRPPITTRCNTYGNQTNCYTQ